MCAHHEGAIASWDDVEANREAARLRGEVGLERHNQYESFAPWRERMPGFPYSFYSELIFCTLFISSARAIS